MFSKKNIIQRLSSLPNRGAGTKSEREGAEIVAETFRSMGLEPSIETFKTQTSMPLIHMIHFLLLFLICVIVNRHPLIGSILGLMVLTSFWGEFTYHFFILRWLLPRKKSQNVVARFAPPLPLPPPQGGRVKIIVSAHIDAARSGIIFHPYPSTLVAKSNKQPFHKTILTFMMLLTIVFIIKAFGGGTWVLSIAFNFIAVLAFVASALMLQWELAPYTNGANDNLSSLAVVLGVAAKLALPTVVAKLALPNSSRASSATTFNNIQFIFLLTGAEEAHCNGMNAFLKQHKDELPKESSYFINLECVGGGRLKYVTEEGFIVMQKHHHTLIHICESAAKKFGLDFEPAVTVAHSDSIVPLVRGYKSIGIIGLNEFYLPKNYHTKNDTEENLDYKMLDYTEDVLEKLIGLIKEFQTAGYI